MTRNLKPVGLALLMVCALGAVAAQGASAVNHEFTSDGPSVLTGKNLELTKFTVGAAGVVECSAEFESTWATGVQDTVTMIARTFECRFGGKPATINFNHCAVVVGSDTTATEGKEHANMEIECSEGQKIEVHTSICTVTLGPQTIPHAVRYENDTPSSITVNITARNITVGKVRNTAAQPVNGCLVFPTGAILRADGSATFSCVRDEGTELTGTEKTTPQGLTKEGAPTECGMSGL